MKQILLFITIICLICCKAQENKATTEEYKYPEDRAYLREDSLKISQLLYQASIEGDYRKHIESLVFASSFLDIPYVGHTLEVNDKEKLVINTRELDCTTFMENVVALTLCDKTGRYTFDDFCYFLQKIRYGEGDTVAYWNRNHYFFGWMAENEKKGIIERITDEVFHSAKMENDINFMTSHVSNYKMLDANKEWLPRIAEMEKMVTELHYTYIPKEKIDNSTELRTLIHDGDILGLTTEIKGLDTQHVGIAVWKDDGLHLMNASLLHKKVVLEEKLLYDYLQGQKRMTGMIVGRIR